MKKYYIRVIENFWHFRGRYAEYILKDEIGKIVCYESFEEANQTIRSILNNQHFGINTNEYTVVEELIKEKSGGFIGWGIV